MGFAMARRDSATEYRLRARQCLEIATHMADLPNRMVLLDMAQAWMLLADQAERNRATDLVYETPPARSATPPRTDASDGT
jgi:hypothetical protein